MTEAMASHVVSVVMGGLFHAAILFLVAAGLQVVFGVQRIFNLACGSFYALGAYVGVSGGPGLHRGRAGRRSSSSSRSRRPASSPAWSGIPVERGLLRFIYDRDETFQLLLTFAVVLMLEDLIQMTWGAAPTSTSGLYLVYGQVRILGAAVPVYNLIVIAASLAIAVAIGWLLTRTAFGRIVRAAAENREMAEALGVDMRSVYVRVFTLGCMLGTLGGALVIPSTAAMSEMGVELIVEAFAVVVIGGLGSMRGRARRRAGGGAPPRGRDRRLPRAGDAADLPDRHRRARDPPAGPLREGGRRVRLPGVILLAGALVAALASRAVAPVYHIDPDAPVHGLCHRAARPESPLRVHRARLVRPRPVPGPRRLHGGGPHLAHARSGPSRLILLVAALLAGVVAAPVGALCVRYAKIYFGMLTLAFGMLFYTFVLKFYHLTGGDEGMRVPPPDAARPTPGRWPKTAYLVGPYYYYSLALLVLAAARDVAGRPLALRALPPHGARQPVEGGDRSGSPSRATAGAPS